MNDLSSLWRSIREWLTEDKLYTRPWNFSVDSYYVSQTMTYLPGATGFMFTNTGDTIVQVNNKILYPGVPGTRLGDAFSVAAHKNDAYKGIIKIAFQAPLGAAPAIEVVQVYYMDVKQR